MHLHLTLGITLESYDAVGDESVEQKQRCARHVEVGIERAFAFGVVRTGECAHLVVIHRERSVYIMLAHIALRHIHKLARQIAYRATLVSHLVHTHRRRYRHVALMLRYVVEVAVENARYIRCIRHYGEHLLQVETCQSDSHVLQCFGAVVGIYSHRHAVVGTQSHIGREPLIVGKEHVVVLVDLELLVS